MKLLIYGVHASKQKRSYTMATDGLWMLGNRQRERDAHCDWALSAATTGTTNKNHREDTALMVCTVCKLQSRVEFTHRQANM